MRVLYVLHQFFPRHVTGTETYTLGLAKSLQKKGHEVAVLCYEHNHLQGIPHQGIIDDEYENIPVRRLCYDPKLAPNPVYYEYYNSMMGEWARAYFREFLPEVIHITHCAFVTSAVIDAAAKLKIPTILTLTDFWFICPRMQLLRDNGAVCEGPTKPEDCLQCYLPSFLSPYQKYVQWSPSAQKTFFRISLFMKTIFSLNRSAHSGALEAALNRAAFLRQMLKLVDTIIAPSRFLEDMYRKNDMGSAKLKYLPFGIDTYNIPQSSKLPSQKLRIAFIGTLTGHKGCHVLIEAFRRIESDRLRLYIYGNTEQFEEYTEKLKKIMGSDQRIRLMGTFPPDDLGKVFSTIDLLVVPSLWYENTPLIVYSALATKTPVVASNMGGLKELIQPGGNGLLFEAGSVEGLKACLKKILLSPKLLPQLSNNIKPVKSLETHMEEILEEYQEIVAKVPKL